MHWELCRNYSLDTKDSLYEQEPQAVYEDEEYKILWEFSMQTDHVIEARRRDEIIVDKKNNKCQIIHLATHTIQRLINKKGKRYSIVQVVE